MILGGFANEEARARFSTEAQAVARLQHTNVVQIFQVGEHRGQPFFSMEFCAGGGLEARLHATPLPPAEAARLTVEAMGKTTDSNALAALARAAAVLIVRVGPGDASPRINALGGAVGNASAPPTLFAGLGFLAEASRPLPGRFTDQQMVDLLKMPMCCPSARQAIVRQLAGQCGQTFADEWAFVEWARERRPDLDRTSSPVRPDGP